MDLLRRSLLPCFIKHTIPLSILLVFLSLASPYGFLIVGLSLLIVSPASATYPMPNIAAITVLAVSSTRISFLDSVIQCF